MEKKMTIKVNGQEIDFTIEIKNNSEASNEEIMKECIKAIRTNFKVKEQMYVLGRYTQGDRNDAAIWVQVGETLIPESEVPMFKEQLKNAKLLMTMLGTANPIIHYEFFPVKPQS